MNRKLILLIGAILFVLLACSQEKTALSNNVKSAESKPVASVAPAAVSSNIPAKLCDVLRKVAPEVRNMSPVGARAQLVMAIAGAFDVDAAALREVSEKIDVIASESCSTERDILLSVVKMKSLQEAVR
jgi:PBP1b-binding outer membrane lipoprotein LpoB